MECNEVTERIHAYCDRSLPEDESREVTSHVRTCARCARAVDRALRLEAMLRTALPVPDPGAAYWEAQRKGLAARAAAAAGGSRRGRRRPVTTLSLWTRAVMSAAGVAAAVLIALSVSFGPHEPGPAPARPDATHESARGPEAVPAAAAVPPPAVSRPDSGAPATGTPSVVAPPAAGTGPAGTGTTGGGPAGSGTTEPLPGPAADPGAKAPESPRTTPPEAAGAGAGQPAAVAGGAGPEDANASFPAEGPVVATILPGEPRHLGILVDDQLAVGATETRAEAVAALCGAAMARLAELRAAVDGRNAAMALELATAYNLILRGGLSELVGFQEKYSADLKEERGAVRVAIRPHVAVLARLEAGADGPLKDTLSQALAACRELQRPIPARMACEHSPDATALPADKGYVLKLTWETVRLATATGTEQRMELFVQAATARGNELAQVQQRGKGAHEEALGASCARLWSDGAVRVIENGAARGENVDAAVRRYVEAASRGSATLRAAFSKASPSARATLQRAIEAAAHAPALARAAQERGKSRPKGSHVPPEPHKPHKRGATDGAHK